MSSSYENSYVTFNHRNRSNVDFPPYFEENNLLSWNKTYEEIIEAFKDNPLFFTYEYIYPYHHPERPSDEIEFLDIIRIVCREENHFEFEIYFPHTRTQEERKKQIGSYCYLYYFKNGLDKKNLHRPQKETFEKEYKKLWEKNSADEKKILALSYYRARDYGFLPVKYDCTLMNNNSIAEPAECLKSSFKISSKAELLDYIQTVTENSYSYIYDEFKKDLQDNPGKDVVEIGVENDYSVPQISRLFFVNDMQKFIGRHGVRVFEDITHLFVLRLGVGAGYVSREESVKYGLPIANQILKEYVSYKDLAAHLAASESFIGVTSSHFGKWPVEVMKFYNDAPLYFPLDEITFDGSDADEELLFDDCYYKPTGEATWWNKVQTEYQKKNGKELAAVKFEMSRYDSIPCLEKLIEEIQPVKYDASKKQDTIAFFNKNNKEIWEKLPENEKFAIAFSSNLFELNGQYHLDFDGRVRLSEDSADPAQLLKDSWGIENGEQLLETFNSLEESGHSGAYKGLVELIEKDPDKNPLKIAAEQGFNMMEATRLCFAEETSGVLGEHGIEAWDEGREITILRWGIAAGYISSDDAMNLIEPLIKRIRQNYISFEDFSSHYIMGRQFYALYDGNYERLGEYAKAASYSARAYIPFENLLFTAENADKAHVMTYSDCLFNPSDFFTGWDKIMNLYRQKISIEGADLLLKYEKEIPECKPLLFPLHLSMLKYYGRFEDMITFVDDNMAYLESLPKEEDLYYNTTYQYLRALNICFKPQKFFSVYEKLPENLQLTAYYYNQYAYANYLMINLSTSQKEFDYYKQKAANAFKTLKQYDYDIGQRLDAWLQSIEGKNSENSSASTYRPEDVNDASLMLKYFDDLLSSNQPEGVLALYRQLPEELQTNERFYYDYGYANYLMAFKCLTLTEKDIYNSRAADVFKRLASHGYELEVSIEYWLSAIEN